MPRRQAVKRIGSWVIWMGALAPIAACTAGPSGETPTPTPSPSPTPTPCVACDFISGFMTALKTTDVPVNAVAYESAHQLFLCHDAQGFYAMSSKCTHAQTDIGALTGDWNPSDLSGGFYCPTHGSQFDGNGVPTAGPAGSTMPHYHLSIDASLNLWVDTALIADPSCRCPG